MAAAVYFYLRKRLRNVNGADNNYYQTCALLQYVNVVNNAFGLNQFYIFAPVCSRSSMDRIMVSGTIDMSSNLVGSTKGTYKL